MGKFTRIVSHSELDLIIATLTKKRDRLAVALLSETGCKVHELVNIKVRDISPSTAFIDDRKVPITNYLYLDIQKYIQENSLTSNSLLLSSRQSPSITPKRVRQVIQKASRTALHRAVNPEDLRKTAIVEKSKTLDVKTIKSQVGLQRFDKRKYLNGEEINELEQHANNQREQIIVGLLLSGAKSKAISNIKVQDIASLQFGNQSLKQKLLVYSKRKKLPPSAFLFETRQKTSLTKERIFQIVREIGVRAHIDVSPRILNNVALARAVQSTNSEQKFEELQLKTRSFHLYGGFIKND